MTSCPNPKPLRVRAKRVLAMKELKRKNSEACKTQYEGLPMKKRLRELDAKSHEIKSWDNEHKDYVNALFAFYALVNLRGDDIDDYSDSFSDNTAALILDSWQMRTFRHLTVMLKMEEHNIYIPNNDHQEYLDIKQRDTHAQISYEDVFEFLKNHAYMRKKSERPRFRLVWLDYTTNLVGGIKNGSPKDVMKFLFHEDNDLLEDKIIFGITLNKRANQVHEEDGLYLVYHLDDFLREQIAEKCGWKIKCCCGPIDSHDGSVVTNFYICQVEN
jgi:hypothetical protein